MFLEYLKFQFIEFLIGIPFVLIGLGILLWLQRRK